MAELNFNATGIKPAGISRALPISDSKGHLVIISESDIVENSAKTGAFVELILQVVDGPHKGEEGIYRINLFNPSEKAVSIAAAQMAAVCLVTNVIECKLTEQLHNIPFRAVVSNQKRPVDWKEGDPEYTEIKGVLHADGSAPGKAGSAPAAAKPSPVAPPPAAAAPPATNTAPAWGAPPAATAGGASPAPPWAKPQA